MALYARVQDDLVVEFFDTDEDINTIFGGLVWVDVSAVDGIAAGWGAALGADGVWSFAPYQPPSLTAEEIAFRNSSTRNGLLGVATLAIAPLQDAVDLGVATDGELSMLNRWKQYRVAVNRMDLTIDSPTWPDQPA